MVFKADFSYMINPPMEAPFYPQDVWEVTILNNGRPFRDTYPMKGSEDRVRLAAQAKIDLMNQWGSSVVLSQGHLVMVHCPECHGWGSIHADLQAADSDDPISATADIFEKECPQCHGAGVLRLDAPRHIVITKEEAMK